MSTILPMSKSAICVENFNCPVCMELAEVPLESVCCNNIFCEKCAKLISDKSCPLCKKPNCKFEKSIAL